MVASCWFLKRVSMKRRRRQLLPTPVCGMSTGVAEHDELEKILIVCHRAFFTYLAYY